MSKEIKNEKSKAGVVTAVVVAIAVIAGGIMFFKPSNNVKVQEQKVATATTAPKPKDEKIVARIDLTTKLVDAKKPQFEVYVDGSKTPEKQAGWMQKSGNQGYVIQRDKSSTDINIKSLNDSELMVVLRGPDKRDENKKFIPVWVKYTSFTVNGKKILSEPVSVWHNKPFRHTIKAKAGDEIKIHAEWTKADK
ncbi:MAG: hypothetical protein IJ677_01710 [Alphaproteobacteria bacterium]|nr:hypothetical protein [Alphaproteobacteria bacterium]